jgi:hypothetical protein
MRCEEYLPLIEDYLEGELDEQASHRLTSHLAVCGTCSDEYRQQQREHESYAHYQRDIELTPSLWTALRKRIENEPGPVRGLGWLRQWFTSRLAVPRFTPAFAVMLVLIAVGITMAVMNYFKSHGRGDGTEVVLQGNKTQKEPPSPASGNSVPAGDSSKRGSPSSFNPDSPEMALNKSGDVKGTGKNSQALTPRLAQGVTAKLPHKPTAQELVREAEQKYLAAIAILSRDLKSHGSQLDPHLRAQFESALVAVDRTIAETRLAVRQHPSDPQVVQYMLTAYAKKVEVLQEMASY